MIEILIWAALIPSIILMLLVLKQDKIESEPAGLLVKLFIFGALICLPLGSGNIDNALILLDYLLDNWK
jgi:RsiW-degrading membrane proteinase PrsW (M82 family)